MYNFKQDIFERQVFDYNSFDFLSCAQTHTLKMRDLLEEVITQWLGVTELNGTTLTLTELAAEAVEDQFEIVLDGEVLALRLKPEDPDAYLAPAGQKEFIKISLECANARLNSVV